MDDSNSDVELRTGRLRNWGMTLFLSPLLYILSVGPASLAHWHTKSVQVQSTLESVYSPLKFIYEKVPSIQPVLDWYMSLWL